MKTGTVVGNHEEIVELYRRGTTLGGIARIIGVATTQVAQVLERGGLRARYVLPPRNEPLERKIAAEYAAGVLPKDIARRYGISTWAVRDRVKRHGGKLRPRGQQKPIYSDETIREMVALFKRGVSAFDIGRKLRIGLTSVQNILRSRRLKVPTLVPRGKRAPGRRKGSTVDTGGYVLVKVPRSDPMALMRSRTGYVREHRLVMARAIGRPLRDDETVHHIDGDRKNNCIENLQLRQGAHGKGARHVCLDCGSANIGPAPLGH